MEEQGKQRIGKSLIKTEHQKIPHNCVEEEKKKNMICGEGSMKHGVSIILWDALV